MPMKFDADLKKLKEQLMQMGAIAERMIHDISLVLIDRATDLLETIYENEKELLRMHFNSNS